MVNPRLGGFFDAKTAREIAMGQTSGNNLILNEINTIKVAIQSHAATGNVDVIVGPSVLAAATSLITVNTVYFQSWNDPYAFDTGPHRLARETMNIIINYFSSLGYAINRAREGATNTFNWKITW